MDAAKDVPLLNESCTPIATSAPYSVLWRAISLLGCLLLACGISIGIAATCSSSYPIILSHAFIAFALGLRHAVDCDHLAAIDNVTRQLLAHGQWPVSVGFWFASGHSSVVVLLTAVLAGGYTWVWQAAGNSGNLTEDISLVAGLISILILGAIGMLNAYVAVGLFSDLAELKKQSSGAQDEQLRSNAESTLRTALSTIPFVKRVFEHVNAPHKMFGVGFLFGLSFDTATQVGLIGLAAMTGTSGHVPPLMVMIFPICFSCGMCLVDTSNGLLMLDLQLVSHSPDAEAFLQLCCDIDVCRDCPDHLLPRANASCRPRGQPPGSVLDFHSKRGHGFSRLLNNGDVCFYSYCGGYLCSRNLPM